MKLKRLLVTLFVPFLFASLSGCELLEDVSKTEFDKELEYITKVWKVDSVRVREYGFVPSSSGSAQTPLISSNLLPITKMEFLRIDEEALGGKLLQTSIENGKEVVTELEWFYRETYLDLFYPSVFLGGLRPSAVIFDMVEISEKRLVFKREENLVNEANGAQFGSLERYYYLSK